jgi:cytochrome c oxidase subunit 2
MDAQSLISLAQWLLVLILGMVCANLYLVFRLKDLDPFARWNANLINAWLMLLFMIGGFIAAAVATGVWKEHFTLVFDPASEHGEWIDAMFWRTMAVSIFVTVITNVLLFYYAWRYRAREGQKALFYPHNNKLELIWTIIPAIVLTALILDGAFKWLKITAPAPDDALLVEVNGKQFAWTARYPGADLEFGETNVRLIDEGKGNTLGFNLEDKRGHDDLVTNEMVIPVNTDIEMKIRSRDVLHSATLAHFRVKMDAVPGMMTRFHFKPTKTTAEMRELKGNPDFEYEMSCQQICGGGHWNMRLVVKVVTMEEYKAWLAQQQTFIASYRQLNPEAGGAQASASEAQEGEAQIAVSR